MTMTPCLPGLDLPPAPPCGRRMLAPADWDGITFLYLCVLHAGHDGDCWGRWTEQAPGGAS